MQRCNRMARHVWLDRYSVATIEDARDLASQWLWTCSSDQPNMGIGAIASVWKPRMAALYGIDTLRAAENFPVSGLRIGALARLIRAMALTRKAVALANPRLGQLPEAWARVSAAACAEIIAGQHAAHFIVDVLQGGGMAGGPCGGRIAV